MAHLVKTKQLMADERAIGNHPEGGGGYLYLIMVEQSRTEFSVLLQLSLHFTKTAQKRIRLKRKMGVWCMKEGGKTMKGKEPSLSPTIANWLGSEIGALRQREVLIRFE